MLSRKIYPKSHIDGSRARDCRFFCNFAALTEQFIMKRIVIIFAALLMALGAYAQPRAVGGRVGANYLEATYQHVFGYRDYLDVSLGLDYGWHRSWKGFPEVKNEGRTGCRISATYNYVLARPAWTSYGSWNISLGPGVSLGYVQDGVHYDDKCEDFTNLFGIKDTHAMGFMIGICLNASVEYSFDELPINVSLEMRPTIGAHINSPLHAKYRNYSKLYQESVTMGFYEYGLCGFIPTIAVRYRF